MTTARAFSMLNACGRHNHVSTNEKDSVIASEAKQSLLEKRLLRRLPLLAMTLVFRVSDTL
jgi:hypothetical protein